MYDTDDFINLHSRFELKIAGLYEEDEVNFSYISTLVSEAGIELRQEYSANIHSGILA